MVHVAAPNVSSRCIGGVLFLSSENHVVLLTSHHILDLDALVDEPSDLGELGQEVAFVLNCQSRVVATAALIQLV